jgi:hypothetical protein
MKMSTDVPKTTYVIGHVDSFLAELQALLDWIAQDAISRSAKARVVFLGSVVGGIYTRAVVREVLQTLERFPGSILISGRNERNLLDFLEDNWTQQPILDWASHLGGNDILKSFGIYTETTKIADGRRTVIQQIPDLLELLKQAKEYEVEDGYCFVEGNAFPDAPLFQSEIKGISDEALSVWHRATGRTIVHVDGGATTHYTACEDHIGFGMSPNATGWVSALAIDDGKAARHVLARRQERDVPIQLEVLPFDRRLAEDPDRWLAVGRNYNWAGLR